MKLRKNLAIYAVSDLLGRSIGLIASPISTRLLTPQQYGAIGLLGAVWSTVALIQYGGMDSAYPFFSVHSKDNKEQILSISTIIATISFFSLWIVFSTIGLIHPWLQNYAQINKLELFLFLLALIPSSLIGWYLYLLRFLQQALAFARINLLGKVLGVLISLPIIYFVPSHQRLALMFSISTILQILTFGWVFYEFRKIKIVLYSLSNFSLKLAKKMFSYGIILVPGAIIYSISFIADKLLVGWLAGPDQVAILILATSVASVSLLLKQWFALTWDPNLIEWLATKNPKFYLPKLQATAIAISIVFCLIACLAEIWGQWVIAFLYPPYYLPVANLVPIICLTAACSTLSLVAVATTIIADTPIYFLPIYSLALFVNCLAGILLIPRLGALGAIYGTFIGEIGITLSWILVGKLVLKNLPLNWGIPTALIGFSIFFIMVYSYWQYQSNIPLSMFTSSFLIIISTLLLWQQKILETVFK
ncbi:lipopolysaccharide biosynthesis protein [Pseudanabaena minima]|uniref:lipopolysaccharide biosynthesis protein n=1 Tax=Pseudanabaena minima TaxID=890415 RepID=UPI003DA847BE